MVPATLFHGSPWKTDDLKPGFLRTGKLKEYDQTESNRYLYATDQIDEAVFQGFCSLLERHYDIASFHSEGKLIEIRMDSFVLPTIAAVSWLELWCYHIVTLEEDGWERVNSEQNPGYPEYRTQSTIPPARCRAVPVDLKAFLAKHRITVITQNGRRYDWQTH